MAKLGTLIVSRHQLKVLMQMRHGNEHHNKVISLSAKIQEEPYGVSRREEKQLDPAEVNFP